MVALGFSSFLDSVAKFDSFSKEASKFDDCREADKFVGWDGWRGCLFLSCCCVELFGDGMDCSSLYSLSISGESEVCDLPTSNQQWRITDEDQSLLESPWVWSWRHKRLCSSQDWQISQEGKRTGFDDSECYVSEWKSCSLYYRKSAERTENNKEGDNSFSVLTKLYGSKVVSDKLVIRLEKYGFGYSTSNYSNNSY